jgi:hypothetical protein
LLRYFLHSSILLERAFVFLSWGFVYLLLVFCFFLLIFLNLQSILQLFINSPTIFNCLSTTLRLDLFHSFEGFYDGYEIAFEEIRKTIFLFDWDKRKDPIFSRKFLLVMIVANNHLPDNIFMFLLIDFERLLFWNRFSLFYFLDDLFYFFLFLGWLLFGFLYFRFGFIWFRRLIFFDLRRCL